jgi:Sulfatase-modifying factor enzyme 1/Domain of unknown function (DUF4388)
MDPRGFSGRLQNFHLLDIIQMACLAQRDGCLQIRHRSKRGEVLLRRGQIYHAEVDGLDGEDALLEILCWDTGIFSFSSGNDASGRRKTIDGAWEHVLMEAVRRRDEILNRSPRSIDLPIKGLNQELAGEILELIQRQRAREQQVRLLQLMLVAVAAAGILLSLALFWNRIGLFQPLVKVWEKVARFGLPAALVRNPVGAQPIPAGEFIFQDGQQRRTGAYTIDRTEVRVWEYQQFLETIGTSKDYDHPNQPPGKSHSNPRWTHYASIAMNSGEYHGGRLSPEVPAVFVDWFDAYAYARWKGRRLPTEEEWEKAARGVDGRRFPWGDEPRSGAANLLKAEPSDGVPTAVASHAEDRSPFGVLDMAGNVSEWTDSWEANGTPVVRGGNFRNENGETTRRVIGVSPLAIDERIGFRTAASD